MSVVTWADSSSVQDLLKNVQQIQVTREGDCVSILGDAVVTWGCFPTGGGGDSK